MACPNTIALSDARASIKTRASGPRETTKPRHANTCGKTKDGVAPTSPQGSRKANKALAGRCNPRHRNAPHKQTRKAVRGLETMLPQITVPKTSDNRYTPTMSDPRPPAERLKTRTEPERLTRSGRWAGGRGCPLGWRRSRFGVVKRFCGLWCVSCARVVCVVSRVRGLRAVWCVRYVRGRVPVRLRGGERAPVRARECASG